MKTYTLKNTKPTINAEAQKYLDQSFAQEMGLPTLILMEQAAMAISHLIMQIDPKQEKSILFLVGKGNNGGDAFASARQLLAKNYSVQVLEIFQQKNFANDAAKNKSAYESMNGKIFQNMDLLKFDFSAYDIIVDGIMGTGFTLERPLSEEIKKALDKINCLKNMIKIAIDTPTGIETKSGACDEVVFKADYTVTFSAYKTAMYADPASAYCGHIILDDIGMPEAWIENKLMDFQKNQFELPRVIDKKTIRYLEIKKDSLSHKGKAGKTLIIGGSIGMNGAIHLALKAAHTTGVGYAYCRSPKELVSSLLLASPQSLIDVLPKSKQKWLDLINKMDSIAIGPGADQAEWLDDSLELFLEYSKQLIIDADGLNYLAKIENWQEFTKQRYNKGLVPVVLTPHPGEFKRLAPNLINILSQDRQKAASLLAQSSGTIIILKGHRTVIAFPNGEIYLNSSGNQGLAKAGSGDVLTGLLAGFTAQKQNIFESSVLAVYFHGLLADCAKEEIGMRAMQPSDLLRFSKRAYLLLNWQD